MMFQAFHFMSSVDFEQQSTQRNQVLQNMDQYIQEQEDNIDKICKEMSHFCQKQRNLIEEEYNYVENHSNQLNVEIDQKHTKINNLNNKLGDYRDRYKQQFHQYDTDLHDFEIQIHNIYTDLDKHRTEIKQMQMRIQSTLKEKKYELNMQQQEGKQNQYIYNQQYNDAENNIKDLINDKNNIEKQLQTLEMKDNIIHMSNQLRDIQNMVKQSNDNVSDKDNKQSQEFNILEREAELTQLQDTYSDICTKLKQIYGMSDTIQRKYYSQENELRDIINKTNKIYERLKINDQSMPSDVETSLQQDADKIDKYLEMIEQYNKNYEYRKMIENRISEKQDKVKQSYRSQQDNLQQKEEEYIFIDNSLKKTKCLIDELEKSINILANKCQSGQKMLKQKEVTKLTDYQDIENDLETYQNKIDMLKTDPICDKYSFNNWVKNLTIK